MVNIKDEQTLFEIKENIPVLKEKKPRNVVRKSNGPTKEELRAIAWCTLQAYKIYKKAFRLNPAPTPSALIFINAYKFLNKSKDPVVRKYLGKLDIRFKNINLEEY